MLENEVALVTGASRGIGAAIAQALAEQGAVVVGTATTPAGAEAIGRRLADLGARGKGMVLDVADPASVDAVVKGVTDEFGTVSILVNNAGITRDTLLVRMKDEE